MQLLINFVWILKISRYATVILVLHRHGTVEWGACFCEMLTSYSPDIVSSAEVDICVSSFLRG